MSIHFHVGSPCNEEFAELCALSTTGALTTDEYARLEKHVVGCKRCQALLAEYQALASEGMAKLGAEVGPVEELELDGSWAHAERKSELLAKLRAGEAEPASLEVLPGREGEKDEARGRMVRTRRTALRVLAMAAVLVLGLAVGFRLADKSTRPIRQPETQSSMQSTEQELKSVKAERDALNGDLANSSKAIAALAERAKRSESELLELKQEKNAIEAKEREMSLANQAQSDAFAGQKEVLEHQLDEAEQSLKNTKEELNALEDERQKAQLRMASLEANMEVLSGRLRERDETAKRDEEFLASDRDVRELMGARELYISDVFDVDNNGKKRKPFGRVFYTKGKSLIFYAFDLDQQPAYLNATAPDSKMFQVWGTGGQDNAKPFGLGVFYMDNEANRRWVFKSDDPAVLEQVNAVFVTVESKKGVKAPSGKPFLYAYLRTAPTNHP